MIAANLLHDVAVYVDNRVAKVVINGNYEIADFQLKQVTASTLALNYVVPIADISLITLVELRNAANDVLTSNVVNVPITADHLMLQTIEVKEAQ
ncbi:ketopantoate hydroxymethyltransferase [Paenibacillaceae bacterium]|nr:ketopantoate hydroxymethyltransferase [Paenibacillaceae bacterium]